MPRDTPPRFPPGTLRYLPVFSHRRRWEAARADQRRIRRKRLHFGRGGLMPFLRLRGFRRPRPHLTPHQVSVNMTVFGCRVRKKRGAGIRRGDERPRGPLTMSPRGKPPGRDAWIRRTCRWCGGGFRTAYPRQRHCSRECRGMAARGMGLAAKTWHRASTPDVVRKRESARAAHRKNRAGASLGRMAEGSCRVLPPYWRQITRRTAPGVGGTMTRAMTTCSANLTLRS